MKLHKLSPRAVSAISDPGLHSDGGGLYLSVTPAGARSWRFVWKSAGRRREMGLGSAAGVGLADARKLAADCRAIIAAGGDPIATRDAERRAASPVMFQEVMEDYLSNKVAVLRNDKHKAQWRSTLMSYAAKLLKMPVASIETADVLACLKPIWKSKPETADRVRGRIESILNAAKAQGLRTGENPAAWRGHLANILPGRSKLSVQHFPARDWRTMPDLFSQLRDIDTMASAGLRFIILTACRSGEGRGALWSEIDLEGRIWTIPPERTKTAKAHRVPLSDAAMKVLEAVKPLAAGPDGVVFPSPRAGGVLTDVGLTKCLRALDPVATVHGFRSSFRDWAGEATAFPREVAEQALAHVVGSAVEQAYRRGDALEKRRALMDDWGGYLTGDSAANVVPLRRSGA